MIVLVVAAVVDVDDTDGSVVVVVVGEELQLCDFAADWNLEQETPLYHSQETAATFDNLQPPL